MFLECVLTPSTLSSIEGKIGNALRSKATFAFPLKSNGVYMEASFDPICDAASGCSVTEKVVYPKVPMCDDGVAVSNYFFEGPDAGKYGHPRIAFAAIETYLSYSDLLIGDGGVRGVVREEVWYGGYMIDGVHVSAESIYSVTYHLLISIYNVYRY